MWAWVLFADQSATRPSASTTDADANTTRASVAATVDTSTTRISIPAFSGARSWMPGARAPADQVRLEPESVRAAISVNGHPKLNEPERIVDRNILGSGIGHRQTRASPDERARSRRQDRQPREAGAERSEAP